MPQYSGGTDLLCIGSTSSFSITNLAPGYSLHHWNGGNVTFPNGNTSNPVLVSGSSQGQGWVQAVINTGAGQYTVAAKTFWVGIPTVNSITGTSPIGVYQPATYYAELSSFSSLPDSYSWATSPSTGVTITSYGHYASIMFTQPGWYQMVAKAHNACGWSSYAMKMVNVISGYSMAISPNPATGETTVELVNDNKEVLALLTEWDYEIYDSMQSLKEKKTKLKAAQTNVNTASWKDGVYIVRAKIGDEVITEKLIVKH
ncbi:MAG TPA: hypothetical protein DIW31_04250 [Bacteroidales bacterium]|nr:hypothetical protein [Bacteroidales bacterium]